MTAIRLLLVEIDTGPATRYLFVLVGFTVRRRTTKNVAQQTKLHLFLMPVTIRDNMMFMTLTPFIDATALQ